MSTVVPCPICGKSVTWSKEAKWRPFCGERCRLIDLGEWLKEDRRIPADEPPPNAHAKGDGEHAE